MYVAVYDPLPTSVTFGRWELAPVTFTKTLPPPAVSRFPYKSHATTAIFVPLPGRPALGTFAVLFAAWAAPALTTLVNGLPPISVPLMPTRISSLPLFVGV